MKKRKVNRNALIFTEVFNLSKKEERKVIEICNKLFDIYTEMPTLKPSKVIEKIIPLLKNKDLFLISLIIGKVFNIIRAQTLAEITKIINKSFFQPKKKGLFSI